MLNSSVPVFTLQRDKFELSKIAANIAAYGYCTSNLLRCHQQFAPEPQLGVFPWVLNQCQQSQGLERVFGSPVEIGWVEG